jgi:hypothetical protein
LFALKKWDFVVTKSQIPFTDQNLEQQIKLLKGIGGIVGLSQEECALDHLLTTAPTLSRLVLSFMDNFPKHGNTNVHRENYQLSGNIVPRLRSNATKLRHSIESHCQSNPFVEEVPLQNLSTTSLVTDCAAMDILDYQQEGQQAFEVFVEERLLKSYLPHQCWTR